MSSPDMDPEMDMAADAGAQNEAVNDAPIETTPETANRSNPGQDIAGAAGAAAMLSMAERLVDID
ncbi:MAG: hypothetical protein ACOCXA_02910 [Planctomycetota bacterium]